MRKIKSMTFMEVLIALVITGIILPVILVCLNFASRYAQHNANKVMALNYTQGLMEEIENISYSNLNNYNGYADTISLCQGGGINVPANRAVVIEEDDDEDKDIYKKVNVSVSWNWQGRSYEEVINTLRYNY